LLKVLAAIVGSGIAKLTLRGGGIFSGVTLIRPTRLLRSSGLPVDCDKTAEKGNRKHTRHDRSHHILAFFLLRSLHLRQLSSDDRAGVAVQSRPTYFAALRPRTFDALVCHARW
jgi:hypothetical protein